jgi:hypothetical protein
MNADAISQYSQALTRVYDDWHPPIMSILLHYVFAVDGDVSTLTFIQTVSGCLGIYFLAREIMLVKEAARKKITWYPLYILLILLLPISPLPFYLMNFVKDSWILIGLIWIAYLGLKLTKVTSKKGKSYSLVFTIVVLLMGSLFLIRYNAIVLLPIFFMLLLYNSKRLSNPKESIIPVILWCLLPFFFYLVVQKQFYAAFSVKKVYPENQVMAIESVGALVADLDNEKYVSYVKSHLTPNFKEVYYPGNVASVMNWAGSEKTVNQQTFNIADEHIKPEYFSLVMHAPITIAKIKMEGFYNMLKPSTRKYWYHKQLDPNDLGLAQNETFKSIRSGWQSAADRIHSLMLTNLIGGEHFIWLLMNIALLIQMIRKKQMRSMLFIILLLPLAYYFSYLLAITSDDFRFMYPATLLVQVVALSLLFSRKKIETILAC